MIGNLVHSSPNIKKEVLQAGALQPVIGLLRCVAIFNSCHYLWYLFQHKQIIRLKDSLFVLQLLSFYIV